jgi:hypothetical protein
MTHFRPRVEVKNGADVTQCSQLKVDRCFGEICRLFLHGQRMSQACTSCTFSLWFVRLALFSSLKIETCSSETSLHFPLTIETDVLLPTATRTSNLTFSRKILLPLPN